MTRMLVTDSCTRRFRLSMRCCIFSNSGKPLVTMMVTITAITGTANTVTSASLALTDSALISAPVNMAAVKVTMRSVWIKVFCTLVTSLVNRVTSDADENLSMLAWE